MLLVFSFQRFLRFGIFFHFPPTAFGVRQASFSQVHYASFHIACISFLSYFPLRLSFFTIAYK